MARESLNVTPRSALGRYSATSEMTGYWHTLICCLSTPIGSLEAGKKRLRVWLQYACNVTEMSLYFSIVLLVLLWSPYGDSEDARYIHGRSSELSRRCHGALSEMSRRCDGHLTEVYTSDNVYGMANKAGFIASRSYVRWPVNTHSFLCFQLSVLIMEERRNTIYFKSCGVLLA